MSHQTQTCIAASDIDAHPPLQAMNVDHVGSMNQADFFERLSRAGIDAACGTLTPPPGFMDAHSPEETVSLLNRGAMALASCEPRYLPALYIHPDCPDVSAAQMEEYAPLGARMVEVSAGWLDHPGLKPVLLRACSLNLTVSLHGENILQAAELAGQYPELRILAGGAGSAGYTPARVSEQMQAHENLLINLSGALWSYNYVLHEWVQRLGADRLFFGTGYPFCNPAGKLAAVRWELRDQSDSVRNRILSENALSLFGAERRRL